MAVEMAEEGLITRDEALLRIDPIALDQLLHPTLDPDGERQLITKGLPASPGAAVGEIVLAADRAEEFAANGRKVILVRQETSPEDIHGMHAAAGILTAHGGMTSHAAKAAGKVFVRDQEFVEGDIITIDGASGEVYAGAVKTVQPEMSGAFATIMGWADDKRRMQVRTNAETPADARVDVLRCGPDRGNAHDDHGGRHLRARGGTGQTSAHAAQGFRGAVHHHGGASCDHTAA